MNQKKIVMINSGGRPMVNLPELNKFIDKVEAEKGQFTLFAIFMYKDSPGRWNIVLSAPWLEEGKLRALGEFLTSMSQEFNEDAVLNYESIITLNSNHLELLNIVSNLGHVNEPIEISDHKYKLFNRRIINTYFFRVKKS